MKQLSKLLTNKILILGLVIVAELLLMLYFINELLTYNFVYSFMMVLSLLLVVWVVNKDDNPTYTSAWAVIILIFPPMGAVIYLLFGGRKVPKELREKITETYDGFDLPQDFDIADDLEKFDAQVHKQAKYIYNTSHYPIFNTRRTEYLKSGEIKFEVMLEEIRKAEKFVFLEYFIVKEGVMWQTLLDVLTQKVKEGIDVRFIYDDWGTSGFDDLKQQCEAAGIKVVVFNPIRARLAITMNNRSHRKACIVDGRVGIVGGMNIADEYINAIDRFGHWKDTAILFEGEVVHSLTLMFLQFYRYYTNTNEDPEQFRYNFNGSEKDDGFIQVFTDAPTDNHDVGLDSHLNIINNAKDYIYIQTPYLIIGYEMTKALGLAAKSGVDVRIVVPGIPDKVIVNQVTKANYGTLIRSGVKIYEYTPGFVHSKTIVSDDKIAMVGTTNMDFRSYYLHYETTVLVANNHTVMDCLQDNLETFEKSRLITLEMVESVPYIVKLFRGVARLFSGLM